MKTRRIFIKTAGVAAAGMALIPSCAPSAKKEETVVAASEPVPVAAKKDIGLQIYTVRNQIDQDLEATMKAVAETGYNQVEIFGYDHGQYFGLSAEDFYKLLSKYDLSPISSHHGTGRTQPEMVGTLSNGWQQAVDHAAMAGQQYMVMPYLTGDERSMEHYKALPEMLNKAGEVVKAAGMQLCYHNHDFEFMEMEGVLPMYHILDNTDPELVKMELDLYWITKAGYDPMAFFEKYPGRTPLWHVKDMANTPEKGFAEVGNGVIDFKTIFANKEKSGMTHFFVEQDQSDDPLRSIGISYKNVARLF
ncbi:MAG: sugar phosphate isomerase/epimerase [Cyclobacteriaceae bacterium]